MSEKMTKTELLRALEDMTNTAEDWQTSAEYWEDMYKQLHVRTRELEAVIEGYERAFKRIEDGFTDLQIDLFSGPHYKAYRS